MLAYKPVIGLNNYSLRSREYELFHEINKKVICEFVNYERAEENICSSQVGSILLEQPSPGSMIASDNHIMSDPEGKM